jgi:small subunit ribosomal protein S10
MKVKISIALKSFEAKQVSIESALSRQVVYNLPAKMQQQKSSAVSIALPIKQANYTVLRSPHIDKKSREQFALRAHTKLIIINTEIKHLREKLFNLKFHADAPGVQMKVVFQTKTRLSCFKYAKARSVAPERPLRALAYANAPLL